MRIGYSRAPANEQEHRFQLEALRASGCDEIHVEIATGSGRFDHPVLFEVLESLKAGDRLVVWRLDRLAKNMRLLVEIINNLNARNVVFQALTEQIDTSTREGRLFFDFIGVLGKFERELLVERTRAGLEASRAQGRQGGRKPVLTSEQITRARDLLVSGTMKQSQIARMLRVSPATLSRALRQVEGSAYAR